MREILKINKGAELFSIFGFVVLLFGVSEGGKRVAITGNLAPQAR